MVAPSINPEELAHPSFEVLYAVACSYLPEPLRLLKVPPEDVDDLIHDVVLIAHRGLDRYVPRPVAPGEPADPARMLKAWLSGIAWRQVVKRRSRAHRRLEVPAGDGATRLADDAPSSEQLASEGQRRKILLQVLQKIRPERAEVLILHVFLDMPAPDIAETLGLNENTVKSRIVRARADAFAAVKRLGVEERSVLDGSPLLLPFALETSCPIRAPRHGWRRPPRPHRGRAAAGDGARRRPDPPRRPTPVAAAREPTPAELATREEAPTPRAASVETLSVVLGASPDATAPIAAPPTRAATAAAPRRAIDTMAKEHALIDDARQALHHGELDRARAALHAHEREFPRGALAGARAWLQKTAARLPAAEAPPPEPPAPR